MEIFKVIWVGMTQILLHTVPSFYQTTEAVETKNVANTISAL